MIVPQLARAMALHSGGSGNPTMENLALNTKNSSSRKGPQKPGGTNLNSGSAGSKDEETLVLTDDYEFDTTVMATDNQAMSRLKVDIISYLSDKVFHDIKRSSVCLGASSGKYVEFDSFLLNLVMMAKKMAVFGLYSSINTTNLEASGGKDSSKFLGFKFRDKSGQSSELAQLVHVLFPILLMDKEEGLLASQAKRKSLSSEKKKEEQKKQLEEDERAMFAASYAPNKIGRILASKNSMTGSGSQSDLNLK